MAKAKEGGLIRGFKIEGGLEDVDRVAALFGCKAGKLPTSYLGLSLGAPHKSYGV
ncbi:hypothetical protein CK203_115698 [Vitis vinifera]|uniref:Uncharacterized protein n=1 Tax=Vitis vinifera TaxID=29760 RepID=A0A438BP54_VITVI|nr:hypothetical protein CK203_115698 [Vitis vinifera]